MARSFRGLAVVAMLVVCAPAAHANPLLPGGTVLGSAPGNVLSSYTGSIIAVTPFQESTFFSVGPGGPIAGFVSSAVVKTSAPGLDFIYQVNVSAGTVTGLSIASFHNTSTDVSQFDDHTILSGTNQFFPGTVTVGKYTRSGTTGDNIDVTFSGAGVGAEQASFLVIVHTNSPTYAISTIGVSAGGLLSVATLAPVPEPATFALWIGTLVVPGCYMARRKRHRV